MVSEQRLTMPAFKWPVRVYYEDTDAGGVVYHANYLCFLERARTEMLRSYGLEQDDLRENQGIVFAVRDLQIDYLKPARFNDLLEVGVALQSFRQASLTFSQYITRAADISPLCTATVRIACLRADSFKPCVLPRILLDIIASKCSNIPV